MITRTTEICYLKETAPSFKEMADLLIMQLAACRVFAEQRDYYLPLNEGVFFTIALAAITAAAGYVAAATRIAQDDPSHCEFIGVMQKTSAR